jgi:4-alpha-glucanotransferase
MQGFEDPFNRGTFPWRAENRALTDFFRRLAALRNARVSLQYGAIEYLRAEGALLAFRRSFLGEVTLAVCNAGAEGLSIELPWEDGSALDALTGRRFDALGGALRLSLAPYEGMVLIEV